MLISILRGSDWGQLPFFPGERAACDLPTPACGLPWEPGAALRQEGRRAGCTAQGPQAPRAPSPDAGRCYCCCCFQKLRPQLQPRPGLALVPGALLHCGKGEVYIAHPGLTVWQKFHRCFPPCFDSNTGNWQTTKTVLWTPERCTWMSFIVK